MSLQIVLLSIPWQFVLGIVCITGWLLRERAISVRERQERELGKLFIPGNRLHEAIKLYCRERKVG